MADERYYDISTIFAQIEDYLLESMKRNMQRHIGEEKQLGINWTQWQAEMLKGLEEYKHDNERIFNYVYPEVNKKIDELIRLSYASGESEQEAEILAAIRKGYKKYHPIHDINGEFFNLNRRKLNALISETTQSMEKAEYAALRMVNDQYRKIIFGAHTFYSSGAGTLWQAVDMASKNFLSAGLNCIEYKNGKCVNIASYAEMAIRTANTRAYLHGEAAKRERYGIHTVLVNRHSAACPKCTDWQGRVFIDDVWGGGTAEESQAKGYPLLSEAIAGGLYHPNCKDSHSTYFAGISKIPKALTDAQKEEQIRRYNLQQQQRYNERNIRKYKRLYEGTQDESQREKYLKKLKAWQKRIRDLIEENPDILRRAPEREKLRDSLKHLGITPPSVPPGIEIKIKQPETKAKPDAPRIIIEGRFVDPAKKVKVQPAGTAAAERQKTVETLRRKANLVTAKARDAQKDADIARRKAQIAETKAKAAADKAKTARGQVNLIKAKAQLRDKNVSQQLLEGKLALAKAKRLRSVAEIKKIEARAAKRRYSTLLKLENNGKVKVNVNTVTAKKVPVKVAAPPTVKKVAAVAIHPTAEEQRNMEALRAKARIANDRARKLREKANIAKAKAQDAANKVKIVTRKADAAKEHVNRIKVQVEIRDKKIAQQTLDAKLAVAEAKRLRSIAEIEKIEIRAQARRSMALISKQNWLQQIKQVHRPDINKMFDRMDNRRLRFWEKYGNLIKGDFYDNGKGRHRSGRIFLDFARVDARSQVLEYQLADVRVFLHETGHLMDYELGIRKNLPDIQSKLWDDFYNYASNLLNKNVRKTGFNTNDIMRIEANLSDRKTEDLRHSASDIIEGLTREKIKGSYGHGISYWTDEALAVEAIAHMFEAYMNGGLKYQTFKQYFPTTMQYFEDYLNTLI